MKRRGFFGALISLASAPLVASKVLKTTRSDAPGRVFTPSNTTTAELGEVIGALIKDCQKSGLMS